MHSDQKNKSGNNTIGKSEFSLTRQDSFFNRMDIYTNGIYARGASEQNHIPIIPEQQSVLVPKSETYGNVFQGFRRQKEERPAEPKTNHSNSTQNYQRQCLQYQKYFFDSRIKMIIKRMAIKAYNQFKNDKQGQFFIFPVQRLLVTIAKKLLLNRFELFFLQYTFQTTKWAYDADCIRKHAHSFKSYLMLSDSQIGNSDIKLIEIYILYCAFFAKKSLNQLASENFFNNFCQQLCPRFKDSFTQWTQNAGMLTRVNPKLLNTIFKRLTFYFEKDHEDFQNYCLVVEQIIDISPAYNADKSGKQKKPRKSKKQIKQKQEQSMNIQKQESHDLHRIIQQDQSLDIQPPKFRNKKSSIISSVDLLQPGHYLTRSASQNQRK